MDTKVSAGKAPGSGDEHPLFVRKSSGLIREFGLADVFTINLTGVNLGIIAALGVAGVSGLWPGASMVLVVILGALVSLATVGVYGLFSATMPRAGGDYVFVGRAITPWVGFLANWIITWSLFAALGIFSVGLVTQALAPAMSAFGTVAGSHWFISAASDLSTNHGLQAGVAVACIVGVVGVAMAGDRAVKYAFRGFAAIAIFGILIALFSLLLVGHDEWVRRIDGIFSAEGRSTIEEMRNAAFSNGFSNPGFSLSATMSALPYAFFAYVGMTYTSYLGGEIQRPQRSQPIGMLLALGISLVFYVLFFAGAYGTFGWSNIHAWSFLAEADPEAVSLYEGAPNGAYLLGTLTGSPVLSAFIGLSLVTWFVMFLLFAVIMPIRNLFAWSIDGVIPSAVAKTTRKGTPIVATLIVGGVAIGVVFIAIYTEFISLVVNYTLFFSVTFLIGGVAAAVFPFRRPDLLKNAPRFAQRRYAGLTLFTIAGTVQAVVFTIIIIEALSNPAFAGPNGRNTLFLIGGLLVAAPVVFFTSRAIRIREGRDVDGAWRELPPD